MNSRQVREARANLGRLAKQDIANRLRDLIDKNDWSTSEAAEALALSYDSVENILEKGEVTLQEYLTIMVFCGLTISVMPMEEVERLEREGNSARFEPTETPHNSERNVERNVERNERNVVPGQRLVNAQRPTQTSSRQTEQRPTMPQRDSRGRFVSRRNAPILDCERPAEDASTNKNAVETVNVENVLKAILENDTVKSFIASIFSASK